MLRGFTHYAHLEQKYHFLIHVSGVGRWFELGGRQQRPTQKAFILLQTCSPTFS